MSNIFSKIMLIIFLLCFGALGYLLYLQIQMNKEIEDKYNKTFEKLQKELERVEATKTQIKEKETIRYKKEKKLNEKITYTASLSDIDKARKLTERYSTSSN